jgi:hypothetical protein
MPPPRLSLLDWAHQLTRAPPPLPSGPPSQSSPHRCPFLLSYAAGFRTAHTRCSMLLPGAGSWPCPLRLAHAFVVKLPPALLVVDEEDNQHSGGEDAVASFQTLSPRRARLEVGSPSWRQILLSLRLANGTQIPEVDLRRRNVGGAVALKLGNLQDSHDGGSQVAVTALRCPREEPTFRSFLLMNTRSYFWSLPTKRKLKILRFIDYL